MELIDFYKSLLPATGHYALFHATRKSHVWAESLEDLVAKTQARADQHSWYYATAAFIEPDARQQTNVLTKRCFYLDLDAGAEKFEKHGDDVYETQRLAIEATVAFARATKLLPSFIVSSGAGLHVYYALDEDLLPHEWKPLADALKKFAIGAGLKVDPSCTGDSARVLRPLGALHKNGERVTMVKDTGKVWSVAALRELLPAVEMLLPTSPLKYDMSVNDDIQDTNGPASSAVKIAEQCAAMRTISQSRGNVAEPLWRGMIGLVKHTVEGAEQVHAWSNGHPGYDWDATQAKFDRYAAGPTTCSFFADHCKECASCPHQGTIKSPIVLGRMSVKEEIVAGVIPVTEAPAVAEMDESLLGEDYRIQRHRGKLALAGISTTMVEMEDGSTAPKQEWTPFCDDAWWLEDWTSAGRSADDNSGTTLVRLSHGCREVFDLEASVVADKKALLKYMSGKLVTPINYSSKVQALMQNYANDQLRRIKIAASRPVIRDRFGFQFDRTGQLICAQGQYMIYPTGEVRYALLGKHLTASRDMLGINCLEHNDEEKWDAEVWKTHIKPSARKQVEFYQKYYGDSRTMSVAQLAIMLHLASPMLVFSAPNEMVPGQPLPSMGFTVSLYSAESGKGKTAIQYAASSAFGDPTAMVRPGSSDDMTFNAQSARASALATMPYGLDEVTQNNPQQVGAVINRISGGSDKLRSSRDGSLARAPLTWALISVVSTNMPQREMLSMFQKSSDALQMRLLELNCDVLPTIDSSALADYEAARAELMVPNIGALGACINLYCVMKGVKGMRELMRAKLDEAARLMGGANRERFILKGLACVLAVQEALEAMKLAPFALQPMVDQYRYALNEAREYSEITRKSGIGQLKRMLADLSPHFMVTAAEAQNGRTDLIENERTLRLPLHGRQVRNGRYTYVTAGAMQTWCQEQGYSFAQMIREGTNASVFMPVDGEKISGVVHMTKGVANIASKRDFCYKINDAALFGVEPQTENVVDMTPKENANANRRTTRPNR